MNFISQICTTEEQSKRLMALGLKRETADMMLVRDFGYLLNEPYRITVWVPQTISAHDNFQEFIDSMTTTLKGIDKQYVNDGYKPAWSLHRLLCLYGQDYEIKELYNNAEECYGMLITAIEIAIENGDFNKEYLVE